MSEFKNKSITTKGMELLSKALAGESLEFTKIELGNGKYEGDLGFTENLVSVKQVLPVNNLERNGSQVTLSAVLRVEEITTSFNWSEIGIYAKGLDQVEHLYMYGYTTNTSYISKESLNEKLIHVTVMVSNAAGVTASIDDSLVYLTAKSLAEHNEDSHAHEDIREELVFLKEEVNGIDISWEKIKDKPSTFEPIAHNHTGFVGTNQPLEIQEWIDFHASGEDGSVDYTGRISCPSNEQLYFAPKSGNVRSITGELDDLSNRISATEVDLRRVGAGYYIPSNNFRYISNTHNCDYTSGSSVNKKLGTFYIAKDGSIRIDLSVEKMSGAVVSSASYQYIYFKIVPLSGGGVNTGTGYYKPLNVSSVDYMNIADGTTFLAEPEVNSGFLTTVLSQTQIGTMAASEMVTNTKYVYLKAGYYMVYAYAFANTSSAPIKTNVSFKVGYSEINV